MNQPQEIKSHHDLDLWKISMLFVKEIYHLSKKFPGEEKFGLTSQIRRAVVSICSNIAEGAGRQSSREFIQSLNIAQGSVSEVETQLEVAVILEYIDSAEEEVRTLKRIRLMICGLIKRLEKK